MALKYIDPSRFIPGIPCRDLTDEEVEKFGGADLLTAGGLYEIVKPPKKTVKKEADNG